jgi:hypothetical protein
MMTGQAFEVGGVKHVQSPEDLDFVEFYRPDIFVRQLCAGGSSIRKSNKNCGINVQIP